MHLCGRRSEAAAAEFENALKFDPKHVDAQYDFGNLLYQQGRVEEAKKHYLEASRGVPRRADIHNKLGWFSFVRQGSKPSPVAEALQLDRTTRTGRHLRRAQAMDLRSTRASPSPIGAPPILRRLLIISVFLRSSCSPGSLKKWIGRFAPRQRPWRKVGIERAPPWMEIQMARVSPSTAVA